MSAHAREARLREMLIQSVQLLAADFKTQVEALPSFVVVADEVALTFDDCYQLLDQIVAAELLDRSVIPILVKIHAQLSSMSDHKELWSLDALGSRPEWQTIRATALSALAQMGEAPAPPKPSWTTFVGSDPG